MMDPVRDAAAPGEAPPAEAAVTVGTFDGVHLGHLAVIGELRRQAGRRGLRSIVVTFDPHPLRVVRPQDAPRLLTTPPEREALLRAAGADHVATLRFTPDLARYDARRFVEEILIGRFRMRHLVIGYDHGLGRGRAGDVDALREIGRDRGFEVDVVPAVVIDGAPISSTRIRNAIAGGDVAFAARALGRPYALHGRVVRGDGRGRDFGFPTANLEVAGPDKLLPLEGIYAVRARLDETPFDAPRRDGLRLDGLLHLGPRPTFHGAPPAVEVHLLDFDGDLYGRELGIEFCGRIREVRRFASVDALVAAMRDDAARARRLFATGAGACRTRDDVLV